MSVKAITLEDRSTNLPFGIPWNSGEALMDILASFLISIHIKQLSPQLWSNIEKIFPVLLRKDWQYLHFQCTIICYRSFAIYQMGRRGKVLPFLKEYGSFFKTHRLFRHYMYALILPTFVFTGVVDWGYIKTVESLWATHARRLNQGYFNVYNKHHIWS